MNLFITGTDTNVGKTIVAAWICMHTKAKYWKPIQTGIDSDRSVIKKNSPGTKIIPEAYKLKAPMSPYNAAQLENIVIDDFLISHDKTVIEGAGGVLVPITEDLYMADLINKFNAKALIVARSKLGVINHTLMTVETLQRRNIDILGIIINGNIDTEIKNAIEIFSGVKILSIIPESKDLKNALQHISIPIEISEIFI